jgi:hypothetical protein
MSEHDPAVDGWEHALIELEEHVALAERLVCSRLAAEPLPWQPPTQLGPLPDEFLFRARQLLRRQQALIDAIPAVLATTGHHRRVLGRITDATGRPTTPIYIDVAT